MRRPKFTEEERTTLILQLKDRPEGKAFIEYLEFSVQSTRFALEYNTDPNDVGAVGRKMGELQTLQSFIEILKAEDALDELREELEVD